MVLKAKLAKVDFDKLEDPVKVFYKQAGDDYVLDAEGVEDVSGLKSALEKERKAAADAAKALKAEQEKYSGVDTEEYKRLKAEAESKENDELKSKGKFDEYIEKQNLKVKQLNEEWQKKLEAVQNELITFKVDNKLRDALVKGGVMTDRLDDAVDLTKRVVKLNDKGDLQIFDKDGSPLDASLETYAKELLKEQKPWLYAASGAGGTGAQNGTSANGAGKKTRPRSDWDKMSSSERTAFTSEGGTFVDV